MTNRSRDSLRITDDAPLRIDFGEVIHPDAIELIIPDQYSLHDLVEGEGGSVAQVSADLKNWISIPFTKRANGQSLKDIANVLRPKLQGFFN